MVALPLRLPTASYGGHMGHFLLSVLMLSGSAPFGNMKALPAPDTRTALPASLATYYHGSSSCRVLFWGWSIGWWVVLLP